MRLPACLLVVLPLLAGPALAAEPPSLAPALAPLTFLLGDWTGGGKTEDGGTGRGVSSIRPAADGGAILRQDHTDLFDAAGKATGGFNQVMLIYAEGGAIRADYVDGGGHVIHYRSAVVDPGHMVTFQTASDPRAPTFRLAYSLSAPTTLHAKFEIEPPGQAAFATIAEGDVTRK